MFRVCKKLSMCLVALSVFFLPNVYAESPNQQAEVLVKVGHVAISQQDLDIDVQRKIPMQLSFHGGMAPEKLEKIKEESLQSLIDRAYKVHYAIDEEIVVDSQVLEKEWSSFKERNIRDVTQVPAETLAKLKANLYLDALAQKAETEVVDRHVNVSDEALKAYYDANKDRYRRPELYTASHIFLKVDPAASREEKEEIKARAEDLFARAKAGEDFYNLAYYESDDRSKYVGGKLGSFHAGQTVPEFDKVLTSMSPGEIAGPVKTRFGYHIIKLDDVKPEQQLTFKDVEMKIREQLEEEMRQDLYAQWMSELRQRYEMQRFDQ